MASDAMYISIHLRSIILCHCMFGVLISSFILVDFGKLNAWQLNFEFSQMAALYRSDFVPRIYP